MPDMDQGIKRLVQTHAADFLAFAVPSAEYLGTIPIDVATEALLSSGLVGLLPLVPFTQDVSRGVIERTADLVKETALEADLKELETLLLVFGARKYDSEFLKSIARRLFMTTEILEESSLYQEWVQAAREQGIASGLRDAALLTLRARLGELPQEIADAVARAPVAVLEELLAHVTSETPETPEQLRARLGV